MNAVVVGASAGLGRALAAALAASGHDLVLAASDLRDVAALASDLRLRHGVRAAAVAVDLGSSDVDLEPLAAARGRSEASTRYSSRSVGPPSRSETTRRSISPRPSA